jgi:heme/copper-type cytochrome/quinol oxidase subunit 2
MEQAFTKDQIEILIIVSTVCMAVLSISVIVTVIIVNNKMRKNEKNNN